MTDKEHTLAAYLLTELRTDLGRIEHSVTTLANQVVTLTAESHARARVDSERHRETQRRLEKLEGNAEDTGEHYVLDLKAQKTALAEKLDEMAAQRRQLWTKVALLALGVVFTIVGTYVATRLMHAPLANASTTK